jgi:ABC-type branched-subunit amino acid transport system substrate-binding protein
MMRKRTWPEFRLRATTSTHFRAQRKGGLIYIKGSLRRMANLTSGRFRGSSIMQALYRALAIAAVAIFTAGAMSQRAPDSGANETEIRIGNLMPYTGKLAAFGAIGKAESAYFDMINERGGINGRKIRFISYDDSSDASTALDLTHGLVEREKVLFMFGSFGTPQNLTTRFFLNANGIPQLFVASGDEEISNPTVFPWTMGWQPSFRAKGRIYANYIRTVYPERKIVALWQNDQFGRDLFKGLQEGLGDLNRKVVVDIAFEISDASIDTHVSILKQSGAEILVFAGTPANAARVMRIAASLDWHPVFIVDSVSPSIDGALRPAGLDNAIGVISTSFLKDASDPAWRDDPAMKELSSFMDKYYTGGEKDDGAAAFGYAAAETLAHVLKQCGDDLSRENIMRQATSLSNYQGSVILPGITINTSPLDFRPIKQMRLLQFDGRTWQAIGDVVETAFSDDRRN